MNRRTLIAAVLLAALALPAGAGAGGPGGLFLRGRFSGSDAAVAAGAFTGAALMFGAAGAADRGPAWRDEPPLLIVDATPPAAEVHLDGRRLGTAGELVALALPVSTGSHTLGVTAPGYRPHIVRFLADGSFPIRVRATLGRE
ncbi:MAG TPA: hypothetical protein VGD07_08965 [Methylomirabilota bacterium]